MRPPASLLRTAAVLLLVTARAAAAQLPRATGVSDAELRDIVALAAQSDARWNARDAAGLSALYTAEGHNRIVGTPVDLRGRDAIRAYFTQSFVKTDAALVHHTVVEEVQRVSPDVVVVEGRVWLERTGADSAHAVVRRFGMNAIVVREGDAWRVRWNRARVEPMAAAAAADAR